MWRVINYLLFFNSMINKISVTILTKNSQKYISECLKALERFDEIVVLDNESSDRTTAIAKEFSNVKVYEHKFIGFGPLKNLATDYASNNWILSVDSDEILTLELVKEILELSLDEATVYSIMRDNYYNHKIIACCGWENDWVNRLFNRKNTRFNSNSVHESLVLEGNIKIQKLKNRFKHYTYNNPSELIKKMDIYSTLWANDNVGVKKSSPLKAIIKATFSFIHFFFLKKGFLNGYEGFLISINNANNTFYKYIKLYELTRKR